MVGCRNGENKIENFFLTTKKAQSAVEYIILIAAVIATLIVFLNPTGFFRNTVEGMLNNTVDQMNRVVRAVPTP